mgnify:CR=1 FL=1
MELTHLPCMNCDAYVLSADGTTLMQAFVFCSEKCVREWVKAPLTSKFEGKAASEDSEAQMIDDLFRFPRFLS